MNTIEIKKIEDQKLPYLYLIDGVLYQQTGYETERAAMDAANEQVKVIVQTERYHFWISQFKPRTKKWQRETLARLRKGVSTFETLEDNNTKIKALKHILNN